MQQQQIQMEPAEKMYVFGNGWGFLSKTWKRMSNQAERGSQECLRHASASNAAGKVFYGGIAIVVYSSVIAAALLFIACYGFVLAIMAGMCLAIIGVLRLYNWFYRRMWCIDYDCPHPYCYVRSSLPTFICFNCQQRHRQLRPNTLGIWSHSCQCGKKLRTLDFFGRKKLVRRCTTCDNVISDSIGQYTNVHIPVIGGPLSGKTHYIMASTHALINTYTSTAYHFAFPERQHESSFRGNIQKLIDGYTLTATPEVAPPALTLKMDVPGLPVSKMLYVYDAAGEAYNSNERTGLQSYYKHICGLIFIIDPCAITNFQLQYEQEINAIASSLRPCRSEIMQVHDRMMRMLERTRGLRRWGRYRLPIAVVVTKVDALGLEHIIGTDAARNLMQKDSSYTTEGAAINVLVQDFLRHYGLSDLLRNLEYNFSMVRYFSCSVLDLSAEATAQSTFQPRRVLDPLSWLLSKAGVIREIH